MRKRSELVVALGLIISGGLASRAFPFLPGTWAQYPGDALWATMAYFGIALIVRRITPLRLAGLALVVSYSVEFSQLYQGTWAQGLRSTRIGQLVFGSGFDWLDLVAYTLGVAVGFIIDRRFLYRIHEGAERVEVSVRKEPISSTHRT